ncbi:hypothetical protein L6452_16040 [Arctium lappa]|uniref:Uncharacterized protein n=1 Tax=Arctium lappa TaxID=4217 RepID=A0ACB9CQN8_ARCLA|nr:hypothetical protein L6452_16040 [Arctium lappa]
MSCWFQVSGGRGPWGDFADYRTGKKGCKVEVVAASMLDWLEKVANGYIHKDYVDGDDIIGCVKSPSLQEMHNPTRFDMLQVNSKLKELVKSGRLSDTRQMFDKLPYRDEVTWTIVISGYVKAFNSPEALSLFSNLWADPAQQMDPFLLSLAFKASSLSFSAKQGESLHGYCIKTDFASSVFVGSALLDMYMKTGKVYEGCRVFDEMPIRNVVSWTTIITGLVHAGFNMEGMSYFANLCRHGMAYDSYTLAIALKACADACLLRTGKEIHTQTLKKGFDTTSFVANTLTTMYNKCGKGEYALYLFEKMRTKDVVSWTTIITAYVQTSQEQQAIQAFLCMRESEVSPNEFTLAAIISGCANTAQIDLGQQFHAHVLHTAGDHSHPQWEDIYNTLGLLSSRGEMFVSGKDMKVMKSLNNLRTTLKRKIMSKKFLLHARLLYESEKHRYLDVSESDANNGSTFLRSQEFQMDYMTKKAKEAKDAMLGKMGDSLGFWPHRLI